ncbi:unnamed protein product [Amoebophrya sp. A25]|nr:unnamed protein product [Amoebophrya sp. A25]|eukprot:GSA25T00003326001.1
MPLPPSVRRLEEAVSQVERLSLTTAKPGDGSSVSGSTAARMKPRTGGSGESVTSVSSARLSGEDESSLIARIDVLERELEDAKDALSCTESARADNADFGFRARFIWLVFLLILQSGSSMIWSSYTALLDRHPSIIYFSTMLIGAGGNAGGQSVVYVVRRLALGEKVSNWKQTKIAFMLAGALAIVASLRFAIQHESTYSWPSYRTNAALTVTAFAVILSGALLGTVLPQFLYKMRIDPAHASAMIQVLMDMLALGIVCYVCHALLGDGDEGHTSSLLDEDSSFSQMNFLGFLLRTPKKMHERHKRNELKWRSLIIASTNIGHHVETGHKGSNFVLSSLLPTEWTSGIRSFGRILLGEDTGAGGPGRHAHDQHISTTSMATGHHQTHLHQTQLNVGGVGGMIEADAGKNAGMDQNNLPSFLEHQQGSAGAAIMANHLGGGGGHHVQQTSFLQALLREMPAQLSLFPDPEMR